MIGARNSPPPEEVQVGPRGRDRQDADHDRAELVATLPSRLSLAAGAWLLIAPFALSYSTTGTGFRAYWNDVLVGIAVIAVAAPRIALPGRIPALLPFAAALGGWLAAAPFLLAFASRSGGAPRAAVNDVLVGVLLVLLAVLGRTLDKRVPRTEGE